MYACMHVRIHACMHVCMYAYMHVCMYACMHVQRTYVSFLHVDATAIRNVHGPNGKWVDAAKRGTRTGQLIH
jgi:hypothetical protein